MTIKTQIRGDVRIKTRTLATGEERVSEQRNLVLDFTLAELAKAFKGALPAVAITAIVVGTDPREPSGSDPGCYAELGRRDGVNVEVSVTGNQVYARAFFPSNVANGQIREAALMAGAQCLARVNDDRPKDNSMTMTVEWVLTLEAVTT